MHTYSILHLTNTRTSKSFILPENVHSNNNKSIENARPTARKNQLPHQHEWEIHRDTDLSKCSVEKRGQPRSSDLSNVQGKTIVINGNAEKPTKNDKLIHTYTARTGCIAPRDIWGITRAARLYCPQDPRIVLLGAYNGCIRFCFHRYSHENYNRRLISWLPGLRHANATILHRDFFCWLIMARGLI